MLAIEIDGDIHDYRKEYDDYRDEFIESIGITTLRISSKEVFNNIENVINEIEDALLKQPIKSPPLGDLGGLPNNPG